MRFQWNIKIVSLNRLLTCTLALDMRKAVCEGQEGTLGPRPLAFDVWKKNSNY